jgi:hypothetical protein
MLTSWATCGIRALHDEPITKAVWEPMTEDQTRRLRAVLLDPNRRHKTGNARSYLLTGLASCGVCGAKLVARPRGDKRRCYVCATGPGFHGCGKIRRLADPVEDLVSAAVIVALHSPAFLQAIRPAQPDDTPLLAEIGRLETRLLELGDDYDARIIDRTEWLHRRGRLQERLAALRARIAANTQTAVLDSVDLAGDWDTMGFDRKRAILAVVIQRVTLLPAIKGLNRFDPTKITITWTA